MARSGIWTDSWKELAIAALAVAVFALAAHLISRPRVSSNEVNVYGKLKDLWAAEDAFRESHALDADADGTGEYGLLAHLDRPWVEGVQGDSAERNGYLYRVFLPVGVDSREERWAAYAWPVEAGITGNRCFVINQEGQVYQAPNAGPLYDGEDSPATGDEAYAEGSTNLEGSIVSDGFESADGQIWTPTGA
ncbi:MAG: hypothetical protein HY720_19785 [Planctomycetes bacterium]|nr:hypothetical protein [Planctomycetota bacterium]